MLKSRVPDFGRIAIRTPLALPGQRIGLMGGSFDPPHEGHRNVAMTVTRRLALDQVWWIVSPGNPLKRTAGRPDQARRMELCRQLADHPRMRVTGFERELGTAYSAATVAFLRRRLPSVRFVWVIGADNLATLHHWRRWRDIAWAMPIAVVDRPGYRLAAHASPAARAFWRSRRTELRAGGALANARPPAWTLLSTRLSPLSSTALRAAAKS